MADSSMVTLSEAAQGLGIRPATLRAQIARGRISAEKRGRDWHVTVKEYERYRAEVQLARPSRSSTLDDVVRGVARAFEQTGEWPRTKELQRQLAQDGSEADLADLARRLDPSMGHIDPAGSAILKVRGLLRAGAKEAVGDFESAMILALERYHDRAMKSPTVGSADFVAMGLAPVRVKRLLAILQSNALVIGGGGGTGDEWTYEVADNAYLLGRARSVEGYLAAIDRLTAPTGILDAGPRSEDWPAVEARLRELGPLLERARSKDEIQDIGRRCREIIGDLSNVVLRAASPPIPPGAFGADRRRKIEVFLDRHASGPSNANLRRLMRSAYDLANEVTHSSEASRAEAVASCHATTLLVRTLHELARGDLAARSS
ncbi:MAG TPA: helix-turn-helix domain-containing protein [Candidatus Limnocylindrales bacterium]|nr:helix-turn-helix domain-containing protein [Candidatus Limnocylindrales bacterium]